MSKEMIDVSGVPAAYAIHIVLCPDCDLPHIILEDEDGQAIAQAALSVAQIMHLVQVAGLDLRKPS